ncbi:MAG: hypothetical protein HFE73_03615 [Firmicutes bacterium]|nr:hypothetical protein [Bacillota bacterium]
MKRGLIRCFALVLIMVLCLQGTAYGGSQVSQYTGSTYTHNPQFDNTILINGVDVSYVQKNDVDWKKAKADGIDFAIIRVGARGYGAAGKLIEDDYYKENIEAAKAAGILVGVYFFSQAIDEMEAWAEANYTLKLIKGIDLDLPVFMDYEFAGGSSGRLTSAQLSKIKMTANVNKFCKTIEEGGYEAGVYASLNFFKNTINGKSLSEKYPIWVAQYNTSCGYEYAYDYWQYTSSGKIKGYSGRVDTNFMYLNPSPEATSANSLVNSNVQVYGSGQYSPGNLNMPAVGVDFYGAPLTQGIDYDVFYLKTGQAGTGYVMVKGKGSYTDYKLAPFTIDPSSDLSGITIERILNKYYTGAPKEPASVTMYDSLGNKLVKGKDYTFTVANSTEIGTATVTINFIGNYTGTKTTTYQIIKGKQTVSASKTSYQVTVGDSPFNLTGITASAGGKLSYQSDHPEVATVNSSGKVTVVGPGTATITVTAAETEKYKSATASIKINVAAKDTEPEPKPPVDPDDPNGPNDDPDDPNGSDNQPPQTGKSQVITTGATMYAKSQLSKAFNLKAVSSAGTTLTYHSSDTKVAKVESNGRVTLMGPGTAKITITAPATATYDATSTTVTVKVTAISESAYTSKYAKTKAGVEKTKVVSLAAAPSAKKVKLTWSKSNSGYAVDYYQIWRSNKKSSGYKKLFTTKYGTTKTYTNTTAKPNTTYWYKVRGVRSLEGKLVYTDFVKIQVKTPKA